ncbi:TPA: hypothetical protein TZS62_002278 [Streptococcus suis]|nr:hypothetical protein [Streptococcus suis]HEL2390849.1 hypothetical protein [Streptococcus suis]
MVVPKFRVWVEAEETMHPVLSLDWSGIDDDLTVFVPMGHTSSRAVSIDNAVLMQSTGLFDKNGKEIFEGDVVESTWFKGYDDCVGCRKAGVVVYRDGCFRIEYQGEEEKGYFSITLKFAVSVEIIGNIYENPELVEGVGNGN